MHWLLHFNASKESKTEIFRLHEMTLLEGVSVSHITIRICFSFVSNVIVLLYLCVYMQIIDESLLVCMVEFIYLFFWTRIHTNECIYKCGGQNVCQLWVRGLKTFLEHGINDRHSSTCRAVAIISEAHSWTLFTLEVDEFSVQSEHPPPPSVQSSSSSVSLTGRDEVVSGSS